MSKVIHNFNDDSNSLRIHVHNLKSISGDDLNLSASDNKNINLNVSGGLVNTTYLDVSNNLRVYGSVKFTGLNEASQVKSLYYNTNTGEITYSNISGSGGGSGGVLSGSDASFSSLDISNGLFVGGRVDISGDVSFNSNVDISGILKGTNGINNNALALGSHIIPTANAQYDLGTAEYKIRHLFLSDNSLYMGPANDNTVKQIIKKNLRNKI